MRKGNTSNYRYYLGLMVSFFMGIATTFVFEVQLLSYAEWFTFQILINTIAIICLCYKKLIFKNAPLLKALYWAINTCLFSFIVLMYHNEIVNTFKDVDVTFTTKGIYATSTYVILYTIISCVLYMLVFSTLKKATISSSGLEVEVEANNTSLSSTHSQLLRVLPDLLANSTKISMKMNVRVLDFLSNHFSDSEDGPKLSFTSDDLFNEFRVMSTDLFDSLPVQCDFKVLEAISEFKTEYKLSSNTYNNLCAQLNRNVSNFIFNVDHLLFVKYEFSSPCLNTINAQTIIAVIEFPDQYHVEYGSILLNNLQLFDLILKTYLLQLNMLGDEYFEHSATI